MGRLFRICWMGVLLAAVTAAGPAWATVPQDVQLFNRDVAELRAVLGGLGLSRAKQDCLLSGWMRLRNRRHRTSSEEKAEASEAA